MREHYCVHCIVTQEEYEIAVGRWYALGMEGCEEAPLDDATIDVKVYFSNAGAARAASEELRQNVHRDDSVSVSPVVNEDWNARWRMSMKPALLAPSWWVAPPWLPPPLAPDDKWIKIEPKMAFGTGNIKCC